MAIITTSCTMSKAHAIILHVTCWIKLELLSSFNADYKNAEQLCMLQEQWDTAKKDQYHMLSTLGNPTVGWQNCMLYIKTQPGIPQTYFYNDKFHYVQSTYN